MTSLDLYTICEEKAISRFRCFGKLYGAFQANSGFECKFKNLEVGDSYF